MAKTLYIGDDIQSSEAKVILKDSDFVDLVYDRLGRDAGMYLESMLSADAETLAEAFQKERDEAVEDNSFHSYNNGHEDGYDEGHDAGYAEGYADGFKDGYKKHNPWAK